MYMCTHTHTHAHKQTTATVELTPILEQPKTLSPCNNLEVAAVGVAQDGTTGNPVCIQIRAPTEADLESVPKAGTNLRT